MQDLHYMGQHQRQHTMVRDLFPVTSIVWAYLRTKFTYLHLMWDRLCTKGMTLLSEDANYQSCASATSARTYTGSAQALDFSISHATLQLHLQMPLLLAITDTFKQRSASNTILGTQLCIWVLTDQFTIKLC